jgi:transcriptional regulator with PAS, ATPase and Fis domain
MKTGAPIINKKVYIIDAEGRRLPISISTALLHDKKGKLLGAVETFRDISIEEDLRKAIQSKYSFEDIISKNHKMLQLFDMLPDIATSTSTVLIEGESGTGKELFARAIHNLSLRKKQPFIAVNCSALPDTLLESELFGYKAGAFTDAKKDKPGRFRLAENGTLFLDEIGDITPAMQVRLLRVLQEKTYEPLGAAESVEHNVRIIVATNKKLDELVRQGSFREDLFYRIHVFNITLPPLRERMEDIPLLTEHFIARFNALQKKDITGVSDEAMPLLMSYSYPGNIRELANIIERAFILCKIGFIEKKHLPETLFTVSDSHAVTDAISLKDMTSNYLINALKQNNWNRLQTARQLGMHKSTLYRKIKSLGLSLPQLS